MLQGNVALKIWTKYLEIRNSFSNTFKDFVYTHFIGEKKKTMKSDQFFSGDQNFSPTNNFTGLKLTQTKSFISYSFLWIKIK